MANRIATDGSTSRFLLGLATSSFFLNMIWEALHQPAFAIPPYPFYLASICALGDLVITAAIYLLGALANGSWHWWKPRRPHVYFFVSLMGLVFAITTEWFALWTGRWSYSEWMPIVPFLRVGLLPMIQLSLITPLCFFLAAREWNPRSK
jgi:hypothetical protein